jgi:Flp pilus assembly protein CpaB
MAIAQRLISTRRGTLLFSALAALLAGALILVYVNRYRDSVKSQAAPVTVLVARQMIPKGTAGSVIAAQNLYTATTIRQGQLLNGALSDPSSLAGKVATHDIYPGAQLSSAEFAAAASNLAATLTANQRVVAIPLDAAHGLIGELQAGDRVDVYVGFNVVPAGPNGVSVGGGQSQAVIRRVMTDVLVIAVGGKTSGLVSTGNANVSLKVTDQQAAELAFASDNGRIWLALRPSAGAKSSPPSIVNADTMLLGVPPVQVLRQLGGRR